MADTPRPLGHLRMLVQEYPEIWKDVDRLRAQRGQTLPRWPAHCFLPLAGAVAILTGGAASPPPALLGGPAIGIIGALTAWRATQGIYRFHTEVFAALWTTALDGELPTALLYHLPEWCVYVECPAPRPWGSDDVMLHGFYAHLEWDANTEEEELRFLLDLETATGPALFPQALHLGEWSLGVAAQRSLATSLQNLEQVGGQDMAHELRQNLPEAVGMIADLCAPLVSVVLYLCSTAAEMHDATGRRDKPVRPKPTPTKKGQRLFPPQQPTTWEVAYRLGAALRQAAVRADSAPTNEEEREGRARPRSHLRRAHWHLFWTGPGRTVPRVRWLHPMLVGRQEDIIPTVHSVDRP